MHSGLQALDSEMVRVGAQEEFLQMVNEPIEGGLDAQMLAQMGGGFEDEEMGEERAPVNTT